MMAPRYRAIAPDLFDWMPSSRNGYYYFCPDVSYVDVHIRDLLNDYLGGRSNLTDEAKTKYRRDVDALLERRQFLAITEGDIAA